MATMEPELPAAVAAGLPDHQLDHSIVEDKSSHTLGSKIISQLDDVSSDESSEDESSEDFSDDEEENILETQGAEHGLKQITSPEIHVNNVPASTDSLVTIRLSEPVSTSKLSPGRDLIDTVDAVSIRSDETVAPARNSTSSRRRMSSLDALSFASSEEETHTDSEYISTRSKPQHSRQVSEAHTIIDNDSVISSLHRDSVFTTATKASDEPLSDFLTKPRHSRSNSTASTRSDSSGVVDWLQLEKTEESEAKDGTTDESTAFLLARLEQENKALATDPRFNALKGRPRNQSRPPSIHVLKQLVSDRNSNASKLSSMPMSPPPMTELEFWAALVKDYPQTAQRLPTLTANKIKGGVPPPLRGVVWMSMVGARDRDLGEQYDKLVLETSPYENLIGKDIGRSFPGVEMFRDPDGRGQQMLAKVLKAFSLYDKPIGYCQGLGFLVGPLLMQMEDKDAFCVLVKLMENYDLRSCFLPNLEGLHLRIYQFQSLLTQHMPKLAEHLEMIEVEAAYLSQWFLSFFAVTCPLPMLFRVYDIIFAEGASETIMRVALSLMRRNEDKIMASMEFEEVMQLLLSRSLWESYNCDADELVNDFMDMTGIVTRDSLKALETSFKQVSTTGESVAWYGFLPDATAAASRFLGRMWTSHTPSKSQNLAPAAAATMATATTGPASRPGSFLRRTPSKQSIASTMASADLNSEGTNSVGTNSIGTNSVGTVNSETTVTSRDSAADALSLASKPESIIVPVPGTVSKEDKDLHNQIEDLLMAMGDMQRQHALLTAQLQKEREERSEDHVAIEILVEQVREAYLSPTEDSHERRQTLPLDAQSPTTAAMARELTDALEKVDERLAAHREMRRSLMLETKQRLRESLIRSRDQLQVEMSRSAELSRQLDEQEKETNNVRDMLRDAQSRLQDSIKDKEKLEKTITEARRYSVTVDPDRVAHLQKLETSGNRMSISSFTGVGSGNLPSPTGSGLRELRLGRPDSIIGQAPTNAPPRRTSSLATQKVLSTRDHAPASEDSLLVELVNAKTAEAVARQELEEVKAKLDAMRKMLGVPSPTISGSPTTATASVKSFLSLKTDTTAKTATPSKRTGSESSDKGSPADKSAEKPATAPAPASSFGASIWPWGKRSVSVTAAAPPPAPAAALAAAAASTPTPTPTPTSASTPTATATDATAATMGAAEGEETAPVSA